MTIKVHINQVRNTLDQYNYRNGQACPLADVVVAQCIAAFDDQEDVIAAMCALSLYPGAEMELSEAVSVLTERVVVYQSAALQFDS